MAYSMYYLHIYGRFHARLHDDNPDIHTSRRTQRKTHHEVGISTHTPWRGWCGLGCDCLDKLFLEKLWPDRAGRDKLTRRATWFGRLALGGHRGSTPMRGMASKEAMPSKESMCSMKAMERTRSASQGPRAIIYVVCALRGIHERQHSNVVYFTF